MSTKIAVVIVCYNGRDYLPDCLNSLKEQTLLPTDIIVVDNASTDGSQEFLSRFPASPTGGQIPDSRFRIITNKKNLGFARANNQGIENVLKNKPDYIFLLNQDTICDKNCLAELVKVAQSSDKIFATQSLILCWPKKSQIQTSGDRIHFLGFGHSGDYQKQYNDLTVKQLNKEITYVSGAAMFINVKVLQEVGLMDKDLFMYHEDLDICLRARFLGYQMVLAPEAIVYHKYTAGIPPHRWYWSERNRLLTLLKFYKLQTLVLIFPTWLFMELGVLFYSLLTGWFPLKIKSYFSICWQLPGTLWKRKKIQKSRKISDRQLAEHLEAKFDFAGLEHPLLKYIVNPIFGLIWKGLRKSIFW